MGHIYKLEIVMVGHLLATTQIVQQVQLVVDQMITMADLATTQIVQQVQLVVDHLLANNIMEQTTRVIRAQLAQPCIQVEQDNILTPLKHD
jgi:hypothetical protein